MSFFATILPIVGPIVTAGVGIASNRKSQKRQDAMMAQAQGGGAFDPLRIPEPVELEVPSAPEILAAWRGEVLSKFPEYDKIAGMENESSQAATRRANGLGPGSPRLKGVRR